MLLHGLMGSPGNFEATVRLLIEQEVPLVAPLYGLRATVSLSHSFDELVGIFSHHLKRSPSGQVDIIGHSLGGLMGLQLAHHFPGGVRTLVGVGATFRGLPPLKNIAIRHGIHMFMGRGAIELMVKTPLSAEIPAGTRVVSIISDADRIVPRSSSELGEIIQVKGIRHEYLPSLARDITQALDWTP